MFLIKWIKEGFGLWLAQTAIYLMVLYSILSPTGILQNLSFIGISIVFSILSAVTLPGTIAIYTIIIRPGLTIAIRVPIVIFGILIYVFIRTPLHYMGVSSSWIWEGLKKSESNITKSVTKKVEDEYGNVDTKRVIRPKLRYIAVFFIFVFLMVYSFGLDTSTLTSLLRDATFLAIPIVFLPLIATLIISGVSQRIFNSSGKTPQNRINNQGQPQNRRSSGNVRRIEKGKRAAKKAGKKSKDAAVTAGKGYKAAKEGKKLYDDLSPTQKEVVDHGAEKGIELIIENLNKIPGLKNIAPRLVGVSGGTLVAYLLIILVVLLILWLVVIVLFWGGIAAFLHFIAFPFIGETFGPAVGMGADYGAFGSSQIGGVAPSYDFSGEMNAIRAAGIRVQCALEGPACLQEMQAEEASRPGSESAGLSFGLEIEEFEVNSGNTMDISGWDKDSTIPVNLQVFNPVQNFKGIDARNAKYRVSLSDGGTTVCTSAEDTEWDLLGGAFGGGEPDGEIDRGEFANPARSLEELTLENCGLLQPGLDEQQVTSAEAEIRYDYSSQASTTFRVMSNQYRQEQGIRQEADPSETADTPVQTYINPRTPAVYREGNNGRESEIFPVRVGFETNSFDTEYRIHVDDFELDPSSLVQDVDRADVDSDFTCEDLDYDSDRGVYTFSDDKKDEIESTQENSWYSQGFNPEAICYMVIREEELNTISATGETLNMDVDGNYTVREMSASTSFETQNSACLSPNIDCPVVVPESESMTTEDGYPLLRSECDSSWNLQASNDGCTVVENKNDNWGSPTSINGDNEFSNSINNRETAYLVEEIEHEEPGQSRLVKGDKYPDNPSETAIGLRDDPRDTDEDRAWIIVDSGGAGVEGRLITQDIAFCTGKSLTDDDIFDELNRYNGEEIIVGNVPLREPSWIEDNLFYSNCPTE